MENLSEILIPMLVCITIAIGFFIIGRRTSPIQLIKPTSEEILKMAIDNVEFLNTLNPLVVDIYKLFILDDEVKYFQDTPHHLKISSLGIEIWSANNWYDRDFLIIPDELLKKYNMTLKEINNTLTEADKKILDHIVQTVKVNNKEFISRLFI